MYKTFEFNELFIQNHLVAKVEVFGRVKPGAIIESKLLVPALSCKFVFEDLGSHGAAILAWKCQSIQTWIGPLTFNENGEHLERISRTW